MATISTSVGTIAYSDQGAGPPVLLLHATLHDRRDYAPVLDGLLPGRRVLALDFPGHGDSPSADDPGRAGAYEFGTAAEEFVDQLDLRNLVVIGNSVGGTAACRLAATRADRISGLVIVNGSGFIHYNVFTRAFCGLLGRPTVIRYVMPALVRAYMAARTPQDREIVRRVTERVRTPAGATTAAALWASFPGPGNDMRGRAEEMQAPALITWGSKDLTSPLRWGKAVQRAIKGSTLIAMPTGHVVFSSAPDEWLGHVVPFLETVQRVASHEH